MNISNFIKNILIKFIGLDNEENLRYRRHIFSDYSIYKNFLSININEFNYDRFEEQILNYVESNKLGKYEYRFSKSSNIATLYSSMYACLIKGMFNKLSEKEKNGWHKYFDSFQRKNGLFYDNNAYNNYYDDGDGWGARHLLPHMLIAYERLNQKPINNLIFIYSFKNYSFIESWLNSLDFYKPWATSNNVFNIVTTMQYSRDILLDKEFEPYISYIENWLLNHVHSEIPVWFNGNLDSKTNLYEAIRGAYHIYPLLLHDKKGINLISKIKDIIPKLQNKWGGFDFPIWSSACSDIDAVDLLIQGIRFSNCEINKYDKCLKLALKNNLSNQNSDGGFVYSRQNIMFKYGNCLSLSSLTNESNMFGTWFRSLLTLKILDILKIKKYNGVLISGYEDKLII